MDDKSFDYECQAGVLVNNAAFIELKRRAEHEKLDYYDGMDYSYGAHTIKVTVRDGFYVGIFTYKTSEHGKGTDVLDFDLGKYGPEDIEKFNMINGMKLNRENRFSPYVRITLAKQNGQDDTCEFEIHDKEFNQMIIGIEIVKFEQEGK